jgi:hypothetical protein
MVSGLSRQVKKACERPRSAQEARPAGHIFSREVLIVDRSKRAQAGI